MRTLRAILLQVNALQEQVRADDHGDGAADASLDVSQLRQGLSTLEQMASEALYQTQVGSGETLLEELPDIPLAEALSQLVEATAETLALSSRVTFSGSERPLPAHLARLLYRIAQEALARVSKHEGARRLRFNLEYRHDEVVMGIEDDGVPDSEDMSLAGTADADELQPPFFLVSPVENRGARTGQVLRRLRSMVEDLTGTLTINSGVEQGVQLSLRLPYQFPPVTGEPPLHIVNREPLAVEMSARIRVLIVDNQAVSRAGLRRLLESYADLEVVGEARDSMQAVSETAELLPQIVLIDAQLPQNQSLETLHQLRQLSSAIRILLLSSQENETLLYEALRAGASGYVLKDIAPDELAQAVRSVARGEILVQPQLAARLLVRSGDSERNGTHSPAESLTAREREVLQQLVRGLRNKEIAARLFVSERTVNFHLANIYAKLGVSGRTEALSKALEQGLLKA
jgi:DNA-binding NarL/FixJ family response regulator